MQITQLLTGIVIAVLLSIGSGVAGAFEDCEAAYNRQEFAEAPRLCRPLAEQGDAKAQSNLGLMYARGQGVAQDYAEAVKWYRKAADHGFAPAQFNLGLMYAQGLGVAQDYAEAVTWYRKAADQGLAPAQYNLGYVYQQGQGVVQDYAEAMKWYRKAADQGDAGAQDNLGFMYAKGLGVAQDYAEAMKLFRKAADRPRPRAVRPRLYTRRPRRGAGLRRGGEVVSQGGRPGPGRSAVQPRPPVRAGQGVAQDYAEAVKWYRKAADQGFAPAQFNLGLMYAQGLGVAQDKSFAHMWLSLAAAQGLVAAGRPRQVGRQYDARPDRRGAADGERVGSEEMTCSRLMQPGPRTAKPVPEATIVAADTLRARWRADAAASGACRGGNGGEDGGWLSGLSVPVWGSCPV